jgi:AcrR family transcriptional regulator
MSEQLVWERPEPVLPAGRPAARPRDIAAAAFAIADREGLAAVSVKRVASRLKVNATALAGYLPDRNDLLDLMLDQAFGEVELPPRGADWRADLAAIARATQAVAQRHPWLRTLAGTRTPSGPNGLRTNERILAALDGTGLSPVERTQLANTLLAYVYGFVQLNLGQLRSDPDGAHRTRTGAYLRERVGSGEYPNLAGVFADSAQITEDSAFAAGLEVVLDGIAARVARSTAASAA